MRFVSHALLGACALLCALGAFGQAGFVTVSQANLADASGVKASAQVCAQAVDLQGKPISVRVGSALGGVTTTQKVCVNAVNGAWSMHLPDMSKAQPAVSGFNITATDNVSGLDLIGPGYNFVQPTTDLTSKWCSGGNCNFDLLPPMTKPTIATYVQGAPGNDGPVGPPGASGRMVVNPVSGNAASVLAGTVINQVGESNAAAFGSGTSAIGVAVGNSDYFRGRVTFRNYATPGATPTAMMSQYVNGTNGDGTHKPQQDCLAAKADPTHPAWLVVHASGNGMVSPANPTGASVQQQFQGLMAIVAQARADGCVVFVTTHPDMYNMPQSYLDLNASLRLGFFRSGAFAGSDPSVGALAYDGLLDYYAALPYDGCTNITDPNICPISAGGNFADQVHINPRGAAILGGYAATAMVTRGTGGGTPTYGVGWHPPAPARNFTLGTYCWANQSSYDIGCGISGGQIELGSRFGQGAEADLKSVRLTNKTTDGTPVLFCSSSYGVTVNGVGNSCDYTVGSSSGFILAPGESATMTFYASADGGNWSVDGIHRRFRLRVQTAESYLSPIDYLVDTAGYPLDVAPGTAGYHFYPGKTVELVNRSSTASAVNFSSGNVNGAPAQPLLLGAHKTARITYLGDTDGWTTNLP